MSVRNAGSAAERDAALHELGHLVRSELSGDAIAIPERGTLIDDAALANLIALQVTEKREALALPRGIVVH